MFITRTPPNTAATISNDFRENPKEFSSEITRHPARTHIFSYLSHVKENCFDWFEISLSVESNIFALHFFLYVRCIRSKYKHKKLAMNVTMTWHKSDTRVSFNSKVYYSNLSVWTLQKPYVTSILRVNLMRLPRHFVSDLWYEGGTDASQPHVSNGCIVHCTSSQMKCNITIQDSLNWEQVIF